MPPRTVKLHWKVSKCELQLLCQQKMYRVDLTSSTKKTSIADIKPAHLFGLVDIKTSTHTPAKISSETLSVSLRPIVGQKRVPHLIA